MTERRAFEIKQQLTEEFNQGKVQEKDLIKRLNFLIHYDGFLIEDFNHVKKVCPYCFNPVKERHKSCKLCGYDLIHDEEPNFDNIIMLDSDDDLDLSSIEKVAKQIVESESYDDELKEMSNELLEEISVMKSFEEKSNLTELTEELENLGLMSIHSFNDENSNVNSYDRYIFNYF